jgi:hypothetical protein
MLGRFLGSRMVANPKSEPYTTFTSEVVPWRSEFRVLIALPGRQGEGLDLAVHLHYIVNGCYAARHRQHGAGGE